MKVIVIIGTEGDFNLIGSVYASEEALLFGIARSGMHLDFELEDAQAVLDAGYVEVCRTEVIE